MTLVTKVRFTTGLPGPKTLKRLIWAISGFQKGQILKMKKGQIYYFSSTLKKAKRPNGQTI